VENPELTKAVPRWKVRGLFLANFRKRGLFPHAEAPNPSSRDETARTGKGTRQICFVETDQRKVAQWESEDVNSPFIDPRRPTVGNELF